MATRARRARKFIARLFLEMVLKPAGVHAWVDGRLKAMEAANVTVWARVGRKMLELYKRIYGEDS